MSWGLPTIYKKIPEIEEKGETDRQRFAISDSPVETSAVYQMKENTLQKIYNYFRGRIKYSVKLDGHSILDTN